MEHPMYQERLQICLHMKRSAASITSRRRWASAVEVYRHLLKCDKSHSIPTEKDFCVWYPADHPEELEHNL